MKNCIKPAVLAAALGFSCSSYAQIPALPVDVGAITGGSVIGALPSVGSLPLPDLGTLPVGVGTVLSVVGMVPFEQLPVSVETLPLPGLGTLPVGVGTVLQIVGMVPFEQLPSVWSLPLPNLGALPVGPGTVLGIVGSL
ncbi:hypothetical protein HCU74_11955 [Spongiibacter sp. KMU-166]|uniref:Uncharacterized protein n=1 Tax=Spongiibacter thalassae TaxID=2721624 RepID=A0ABX1GFY9_9GAMM|nr:hypothetical protein [Spongiibacter thalassae]NKI18119.1 hypothetical protein [Spongiibacter thalassae]